MLPSKLPKLSSLTNPTAVPLVKLDNLASLEGAQIEYRPRGCQLQSVQRFFFVLALRLAAKVVRSDPGRRSSVIVAPSWNQNAQRCFIQNTMKMQFEGFEICSSMFKSTGFVVTGRETMESRRNIPVFQKAEYIVTLKQGNC